MARVISNSIIDCRLSGSIGDKVFYVVNGKQYMKSKPVRVARPKTAAQLDHGARFSLVVKFLQPLRGFLKEGFKGKPGASAGLNAAFSYCIRNCITGTYPDYSIDYPRLLVSKGALPVALDPVVHSLPDGQLEMSWKDDSTSYEPSGYDQVMLLVYNPAKLQAVSIMKGQIRKSERQVMALPSNFKGDEVHCWMAFGRSVGPSKVSDSVYVGRAEVS